jgi:hypothetical protein
MIDCTTVRNQLDGISEKLAKGLPKDKPIVMQDLMRRASVIYSGDILKQFLQELKKICERKGGDPRKAIDDAAKRYERDLRCINEWNVGNPRIPKHNYYNKVLRWLNTGAGGLCAKIKKMQEVLSPTEQFIQDSITPDQDLNNMAVCPQGVFDDALIALSEIVSEETLDLVGGILLTLATTLGVIAAAAAAWPLIFGGAAYTAAVLAARGVATASIAALVAAGLITAEDAAAANGTADDLVNGIDSCLDSTDIGVEEPAKGEGCCRDEESGEILKNVTQMGCEGMEGAVWDLGCMVVE